MNATLEMPVPVTESKALKPAKHKILLADDDSAIRRVLFRLLADEGYSVLTAANGVEALELAKLTTFDLALLDLNMPLLNGWETLVQLTNSQPLLPVVLITSRPNQFFPALASGVAALLEKPLDLGKLFSTIQHFLEEPLDVRLARSQGRGTKFSYIPSKFGAVVRKADQP